LEEALDLSSDRILNEMYKHSVSKYDERTLSVFERKFLRRIMVQYAREGSGGRVTVEN
jgi:hypothetical protein